MQPDIMTASFLSQTLSIAAGFSVIAALLAGGYFVHTRSVKRLEALAKELGMDFYDRGQSNVLVPGFFDLAEPGSWKLDYEVVRSIEGQRNGIRMAVFDFWRYTTESNQKRLHGCPVTVALFILPESMLPQFSLYPEGLREKMKIAMGGQDIDFPESGCFSRKYRLMGEEEDAIRETFNPDVRGFFEAHGGRVVQGYANELIYYRQPRWFIPFTFGSARIKSLMSEGLELAALLGRGNTGS